MCSLEYATNTGDIIPTNNKLYIEYKVECFYYHKENKLKLRPWHQKDSKFYSLIYTHKWLVEYRILSVTEIQIGTGYEYPIPVIPLGGGIKAKANKITKTDCLSSCSLRFLSVTLYLFCFLLALRKICQHTTWIRPEHILKMFCALTNDNWQEWFF